MSTPETRIKAKLNRRDEKIKKGGIEYHRLTFGPNAEVGTPDRLSYFGTVGVYVEVKANGKQITPMQMHRIKQCRERGTPAFWVPGDVGVDQYYEKLLEVVQPAQVDDRLLKYACDAKKLRRILEGLV